MNRYRRKSRGFLYSLPNYLTGLGKTFYETKIADKIAKNPLFKYPAKLFYPFIVPSYAIIVKTPSGRIQIITTNKKPNYANFEQQSDGSIVYRGAESSFDLGEDSASAYEISPEGSAMEIPQFLIGKKSAFLGISPEQLYPHLKNMESYASLAFKYIHDVKGRRPSFLRGYKIKYITIRYPGGVLNPMNYMDGMRVGLDRMYFAIKRKVLDPIFTGIVKTAQGVVGKEVIKEKVLAEKFFGHHIEGLVNEAYQRIAKVSRKHRNVLKDGAADDYEEEEPAVAIAA